MAGNLQVGSVVKLKSGGPDMTVTRIENEQGTIFVFCSWFVGTKSEKGHFPPEALELSQGGKVYS
jgi:uncharacterized protein YodC (DUF2158 family)